MVQVGIYLTTICRLLKLFTDGIELADTVPSIHNCIWLGIVMSCASTSIFNPVKIKRIKACLITSLHA